METKTRTDTRTLGHGGLVERATALVNDVRLSVNITSALVVGARVVGVADRQIFHQEVPPRYGLDPQNKPHYTCISKCTIFHIQIKVASNLICGVRCLGDAVACALRRGAGGQQDDEGSGCNLAFEEHTR